MAEGRPVPKTFIGGGSLPSLVEGGGRLWRWVVLSSLLHVMLISSLFVLPHAPRRRTLSYPVYTVELVGGERLGGERLSAVAAPAPEPKREIKKVKTEISPPQVVKEKKKAAEKPPQMQEMVPSKKSKAAKEQPAEKALPAEVRERLIQAALDRIKDRAEGTRKKEKEEGIRSGSGEGEGAAVLGSGGRGGGIVKGFEFLNYYNQMRYVIRERWTWVGKRSDLEVTVRFGIHETGEIVGLKIVRGSADPSYDDSVVRAVRRASPLPPPPENYRKDFMDVELTFRPKDLGG